MHPIRRDIHTSKAPVRVSFGVATSLCGIGLAWLPGLALDRVFMATGHLLTQTSAFTLAKTLRGAHEAMPVQVRRHAAATPANASTPTPMENA